MDCGRVNSDDAEENRSRTKKADSKAETSINPNSHGSGFFKQERSGSADDNWMSSKLARTDDFVVGSKTLLNPPQQAATLLRSNSVLSGQTMLSFSSSPKTEFAFLSCASGAARTNQSPAFPFCQQPDIHINRDGGYENGGLNNAGMHGLSGALFTSSQWMELKLQALIYKCIVANVPVPSNLLIPLQRSLNPFAVSGSSSGSYAPNSFGWGSFRLGFAGSTDPEAGRCHRTDGKKWRCSRDAVVGQKYCERHINRSRHRSRKPVEGQTGRVVTGSTTSKAAPIAFVPSESGISGKDPASSQRHKKTLQPSFTAAYSSADAPFNRIQDSQGLSIMNPSLSIPKQHMSFQESSQLPLEFVSSDSLLKVSQKVSCISSKNCGSLLAFDDRDTGDQHAIHHFIDDWPKDQSSHHAAFAWPEELKSDWTQLSMSIPMASDFSSSSNSPPQPQENLALSPLRLCRQEFEPIPSSNFSEAKQKQTNWMPISWGNELGGPLGEVLMNSTTTSSTAAGSSGNSSLSALKQMTEMWENHSSSSSHQLGSSPTGVLQKATFVSLSNSSSGSSPAADHKKALDAATLCDDVLGSNFGSSSSIPFL